MPPFSVRFASAIRNWGPRRGYSVPDSGNRLNSSVFGGVPGGRSPSNWASPTVLCVVVSNDTKPAESEKCLLSWIVALHGVTDGQVVAIDGKTLRRSFDTASSKAAIHMVSAWATANHISLG